MTRNLTVQKVAEILAVNKRTVERLISDGDITAFNVRDRCLRIPEESVEEYRRRRIRDYQEENGICPSEAVKDSIIDANQK
jgi:excisionase family DNA binding protein